MNFLRTGTQVLARFSLSSIFLASAITLLLNWQETEHLLFATLNDWQHYTDFSDTLSFFFCVAAPWTSVLLLAAALMQLGGGALVLLGIKEKLGATLLLIFLVPATLLFHPFWFFDGGAKEVQTTMFLKNLAIFGGLLHMLLFSGDAPPRETRMDNSFF